ncbi:MAG: zinc-binding dehydrogenase [Pseudoxanthomonas sp.]
MTDFRPGDEVYSCLCNLASDGTYAEYVSVPAELVAKKPDTLTHDQAAAVPVAGITASLALEKFGARTSSSIFITGAAGGVGILAMLARHQGIEQLKATAGSAKSRAYLIEKCGMTSDNIVNYRDDDFIAHAISSNGGPFDCVLDNVGGAMLSACCQLLAVDGYLASITDAQSQGDFEHLFHRNASFHAVGGNAYSLMGSGSTGKNIRPSCENWRSCSIAALCAQPTLRTSDHFQ